MEPVEIKKNLVEYCITTLENNKLTVKESIDELIQTASDYEGEHDLYDPFKEELMKKKDLLLEQFQKYVNDINLVKKIDLSRIPEKVEFGTIVYTDKQKMFISVALGKIVFNDETYQAISTQVPIYKVMQDLKIGDSFTINNNQFTIKNIL